MSFRRADEGRLVVFPLPAAARRRVRHLVRRLEHFGGKLKCPVCNARVRAFVPIEAEYQYRLQTAGFSHSLEEFETLNVQAYRCPVCREPDRSRLFALYLRQRLASRHPKEHAVFLDIAPSPELSRFVQAQPRVRYLSADLVMDGVDVRASVTALPFRSASVDAFLCSHVLEHLLDETAAMSELHRVLRPGGWGIAMVPILLTLSQSVQVAPSAGEMERWRTVGQGDHVRLHSREDFVDALKSVGFAVRLLGVEMFGAASFARSGISRRSVLYVVEKALR